MCPTYTKSGRVNDLSARSSMSYSAQKSLLSINCGYKLHNSVNSYS